MTTLRLPRLSDLTPEERSDLERIARRLGQSAEALLTPHIFGAQTHWPAWLEANLDHSMATYLAHGSLPVLAKEAMHVAVSMTNRCEY